MAAVAVTPEARDLVLAEAGQRSLRYFVNLAWPLVEPGTVFRSNWHIDAICEYLEAQTAGEIPKLLINIPPRHMKSLTVAVFWPCWEWLSNPSTRWLFASYAGQLATRDSVKCRGIIESQGLRGAEGNLTLLERVGYQGLLRLLGQDWELAADQNQKTRFENTARGHRISTSVGGSATGEGGDRLVIDDPHKADEVTSDVMREGVLEWHDQTWTTRRNDPNTSTMTIIMQRLHEKDLAGHVIEKGGWTHLCLPAEYEPKHPFVTPPGVEIRDGLVLRGDERTEPGELLWGSHVGEDVIEELQGLLGSYGYSGQYQQRPTPAEGGIFKRAWWRFYDPDTIPRLGLSRVYTTWDTALKEKTSSDYTVGIAWGEAGPNRYVLRLVRGRWNLPEVKRQAVEMHRYLVEEVLAEAAAQHYMENAAMGPDLMAALRQIVPGVTKLTADVDKVSRAHAVTPLIEAGNVFLPGVAAADGSGYDPASTPDWVQGLVEECSAFPNGANDDRVDALVYGINPRRWSSGAGRVRRGRGTHTSRLRDGA